MTHNNTNTPAQNMTLERLKSLYELIGRMNSVYDLQELLEFVVDRALSLTGGRRGLLLLSGDYGQELHVAVARGEKLNEQDLEKTLSFVSTTVIRDVVDRGEPRLISDLQTDERYEGLGAATARYKRVRSVLAVPLQAEQQPVGLLYIDHPRQAIFGPSDLDFLSAFAGQAAQAINRARQHQRQVEELVMLNELSRSVVQVLDLEEVLTRIVREACRMLNVETSSVLLLDEAAGELTFATSVSRGQRIHIPTHLKKGQGIAGWVASHGEPVYVSNVKEDPRWYGEVEPGFVSRSLLCVPLKIEDRTLGVLQALNKKSAQGFNSQDVALLSAFAASATVALANARLFREASQVPQLRALNAAALALSSTLDLDKILNTGLEHTLSMLRTSAGAIILVDNTAQNGLPFIQVSRGLDRDDTDRAERRQEALNKLTGLVVQRKSDEALVIEVNNPELKNEAEILAAAGMAAVALVPVKVGSEISGALALVSNEPCPYGAQEIRLLDGMARIIGLAVQNAANYDQVRAQATHLAYLNEVGGALTSSLDLRQILQIIFEAVKVLVETERVSVFLINSNTNELVLRYGTQGDMDIRLPAPWQGIAGWVAGHDQAALVNDTLNDSRYLRQIGIEVGYEARSILCVPLKIGGKVIGVVEALNKTGGRQFNYRDQMVLTDLTRWAAIAVHNARLFDERLQVYQRLAAEQKRRTVAEMRGAMAAVVLGMAHTMNNIVGAIRVWALTLENEPLTAPQAAHFKKVIGQIRHNAEEAIELIRNMRGPLEQAVLTPTDVHRCLAEAIRSCWWPEEVRLHQAYAPSLPPVKANPQRLETVFHNLLSNSIQALTPNGGEIWLSTDQADQGEVQVTIADNGPGIPAELQSRLFDPGVSNKNGGLGIGLWLVETFIRQFEGDIAFSSTAESGTTFTVALRPMHISEAAIEEVAAGETTYNSAI